MQLTPDDEERRSARGPLAQQWAIRHGIQLHPAVSWFHATNGMIGCTATADICQGERLLYVPHSACVTPSGVQGLYEPQVMLAASLVKHRTDPNSPFHDYLQSLPSEFDHPLEWSADELVCLKGTTVWEMHQLSLEVVDSVVELCPNSPRAMIRWAVEVMMSRAFESEVCGLCVIPLADQFNHSSTKWHTRVREVEGGFQMLAEKPVKKGEEIFNNYGLYTNEMLLLTHGFIEFDNPHDHFITIEVSNAAFAVDVNDTQVIPDDIRDYLASKGISGEGIIQMCSEANEKAIRGLRPISKADTYRQECAKRVIDIELNLRNRWKTRVLCLTE
ncbi:hypothetical protein Pmar_PMAR013760 [Perkinsus marinus ATCC 50983]|uniref:SET domain-containing protein n=1 Tax=Perkinsus marinus (strain ATCC 50983 / TXsc) TaxID=423536 RepID=C5LY81_PERM5|nr:hypothetical protein Pmar_PMAR013760 [Perkinsus marinus ATCC 50983]EEQ98411.1 hypothetical protein Pmar_PMAR013760 [Perkinsus marinus ATCC 50983]|eukprot:XP_002765694.1 hypothetical protein Pmar_PMAR013760 [Perkinsus marinus ATCC 50983]